MKDAIHIEGERERGREGERERELCTDIDIWMVSKETEKQSLGETEGAGRQSSREGSGRVC